MNLNWTEIKAGRVDCDGGDGGGSGGLYFFFFPISDKSKHPHAERLAGGRERGANVTPGYNGIHPGCVTFTTIMTLAHTPISMTSEQDTTHTHTHTPTIMTKDATCIQMRVEVRARQILQGAAGGPEGRSSRSPRCTITVRLDEDGDAENMIVCVSVCELMGDGARRTPPG